MTFGNHGNVLGGLGFEFSNSHCSLLHDARTDVLVGYITAVTDGHDFCLEGSVAICCHPCLVDLMAGFVFLLTLVIFTHTSH